MKQKLVHDQCSVQSQVECCNKGAGTGKAVLSEALTACGGVTLLSAICLIAAALTGRAAEMPDHIQMKAWPDHAQLDVQLPQQQT